MFRHSTKLILAGLTTAAVMATGGCSKKPDAATQGSAQVAVHALSLSGDVKAMDVAVSGNGIATPMDIPLFKQADGTWKALVNHIPVGTSNRSFMAKAYDSTAKTHQIYSGSVSGVTITKNQIADVVIVMQEDHAPNGFGNHAPIVDSLSVSATGAVYGEKIAYTLAAHDPDTGETATLNFVNTPSCGTFGPISDTTNAQGQRVWASLWTAPPSGTSCQLNMVVTDVHGAKAMAAVTISISAGVDVGGARVSTLVESYPVLTGITTNPAIISGAGGTINLQVLYSMSDNEPASFAWTHPDCDGSFDNATVANPVFTLTTVPSSIPPICTFAVTVSGPDRTPTGGTARHLSTIGSLTVNVGETTVPGNPGGGVAIDMTSQSLETVVDPNQPVVLYVKASEHTAGASLTSYLWSALHGNLGTPTNASDLSNSQVEWTPPASMDPNETVNVVVTDSLGATATYTFIIGRGINPCVGPNTDGNLCNDGDPCTVDHCMNQVCVPGPQNPCTAIDECHENGVCDHVTGSCSTPLSGNGKDCSDGDACTLADKCAAGVCTPTGGTTQCSPLDQCHVAGVCDHVSGSCSNPAKPDDTVCSDSNVCTTGETCQNGQCTGGVLQTTCQPTDSCHLVGTCDPVTGCSTPVAPDTTPCNFDNDGCTVGDHCLSGACVAGGLMSCQPVDLCHLAGVCVHPAGTCPTGAWSITCGPTTGSSAGNALSCGVSDGQCHSCATPTDVKKFNDPATPGSGVSSIAGMALDSNGAQLVSATLVTTANFGSGNVSPAGGMDVVVAKLVMDPNDPSDPHWTRTLGDTQDQMATGLAVTKSGRVAVMGNFSGSITAVNTITDTESVPIDFIAALDNAGTKLWADAANTKAGALLAIAGNPNRDEFVVCGYTAPSCAHDPSHPAVSEPCEPMADLGVAGYLTSEPNDPVTGLPVHLEDIVIAKVNSITGAVMWGRQYGAAGSQMCTAIALDDSGNVFAAGSYNGTLGFGTGLPSYTDYTIQSVWVAKLDGTNGDVISAKTYGGVSKQAPRGIALDSNGNLAITGNMKTSLVFGATTLTGAGGTDGFLAKLNPSLLPIWAESWGDSANQEAHSVAFDSAGDIVVVGLMKGATSGFVIGSTRLRNPTTSTTDAYLAKFKGSDGTPVCAANYGDAANQSADSVAIASDDKISVSGFGSGTFSFGTLPFTSSSPTGFVVQLTTP